MSDRRQGTLVTTAMVVDFFLPVVKGKMSISYVSPQSRVGRGTGLAVIRVALFGSNSIEFIEKFSVI